MTVKKSDRNRILCENAALAEDDPKRLGLNALRILGVVTQVTMSFWYRGEEYVCSNYIDDEVCSGKEIMELFVAPFEQACEKRDKELGE